MSQSNPVPALNGGSLVQRAISAVTGHIRDAGLKVGDSLPGEGYFAERVGVSRAVMREAFGALGALRLIDVANGRKARVGAMDGGVLAASLNHAISTSQISVSQVWDVRRTVELRTCFLAAEHRSDAQAERLVALVDLMANEIDDGAPTSHDIAFHTLIAEASGNPLFVAIVNAFEPLMQVAVPEAWKTRETQEQREEIIERHRQLANAIRDRDSNGAAACMGAHFDASIGALLQRDEHARQLTA